MAMSASHAQPPIPYAVQIKPSEAYDVFKLPDDQYGRFLKYGKELIDRTFAYVVLEVKDPKMRYPVGNFACTSCRQASATREFAVP